MDLVGKKVRSFDFECRDLEGPRAAYVEGIVVAIVNPGDCDRYQIRVTRRVFGGVERPYCEDVFPPVNGTPALFGGVTDGVEEIL